MAITTRLRLSTIMIGIGYTVFLIILQQSITSYNLIALVETQTSKSESTETDNINDVDVDIFHKEAIALPSIRVDEEEDKNVERSIYGGKGDKVHLGGFTTIDFDGISPNAWRTMMEKIGVKSLLDVGCGKGISTSFFQMQGLDTFCVEGSHDGVSQTLIPDPSIITEHDYSRGPWWPSRTVDAIWCIELLEHIGRNYHPNLFPTFKKAGLVFASHSVWGGWHHVEIHLSDWWIAKFQMHGFVYSKYLTNMMKSAASACWSDKNNCPMESLLYNCRAQHLWTNLLVFINPTVASLPEHAHLLSEFGCGKTSGHDEGRECGTQGKKDAPETPLPEHFKPILFDEEKFKEWEDMIQKATNITTCKD